MFSANGECQIMIVQHEVLKKLSIHGHRGSRGTHPENTIPAFEEAVAAGANVLELDLQMTKDDVPVVSHEPDLTSKLCRYKSGKEIEKPIPLRSITAKELEQFECGMVFQERFPDQKKIGVAIPTFDTFLKWRNQKAKKLELNVETKMTADDPKWIPDPTLFATKVIELLKKHKVVDKTILQSFDFRTLTAAKKIEPKLALSCLFEEEKGFCEATAKIGAQWASPEQSLVTAEEVAKCHAKGIKVVPWTANEKDQWHALLAKGVDAIITDYPRNLNAYVQELKAKKK